MGKILREVSRGGQTIIEVIIVDSFVVRVGISEIYEEHREMEPLCNADVDSNDMFSLIAIVTRSITAHHETVHLSYPYNRFPLKFHWFFSRAYDLQGSFFNGSVHATNCVSIHHVTIGG